MDEKDLEQFEVARIAAHASELAAANIRKYLEAHAEFAMGPTKPVNRVMKIADELSLDMREVIASSARLAQKSLKQFTGD
jgi:hypothetical protein